MLSAGDPTACTGQRGAFWKKKQVPLPEPPTVHIYIVNPENGVHGHTWSLDSGKREA